MKVKNIMFSGFMAAILMSATGAADAAISVASKDYVDAKATAISTSLTEYKTANDAKVNKNAADIATNAGSIATVSGALQTLSGVVDTKVAQSAYDAKVAELVKADSDNLAAAKKYTDDEISELNESLTGTAGGLTTLTQTVADLDAAYKLADQGLSEDIAANADAIAAINNAETGILKSAKDYADGLAVNYDSVGSAAQALTDAKAYTDALENGAVKANADAIAALDTTYVSENEMTTFKTSNTDAIADAKKAGTDAAAALTEYKTTNDAAVADAAQAAADAAAAAAKALTDAQTYADGKDAALKSDLEGQIATAKSDAATDATNKANAAQAAAEATAAADATSKANAAQAAAEATAAADATSKANAAQAAAEATAASALSAAKSEIETELATKITTPKACETQDCVLSINKSTGTISWTPLTEPVDDYLN